MSRIRTILDWVTRLTSVAVLLAIAWILVLTSTSLFGAPPPVRVEQVAGAALDKAWHLGKFEPLPGSTLLYAALSDNPAKFGSSYGGGGNSNLLFFDPASKKGHWLFPGNDQTIRSQAFLSDHPGKTGVFGPDGGRTVAQLIEVEVLPKDGRPAQRQLVLADAEGRHLTTLADGIDDMLGWHQVDGQSVLVFYTAGGIARVLDYDLAGHAIRSDGALSAEDR